MMKITTSPIARLGRLSNAEFELGQSRLATAGLATDCPCYAHVGFDDLDHTDEAAVAACQAIPCAMDEIRFNQHYVLAGLKRKDLLDRWEQLDNPANQEMISLYTEHLEELVAEGIGLTLVGTLGTGKTTAAAYIARLGVNQWGSDTVTFTSFSNALKAYEDERLAVRLETSRLLVIDEVMIGGTERQSEFYDDRMSEIIVDRYAAKRATIITANHTVDELTKAYPRMMSRLGEMNETLVYAGKNHRDRPRSITQTLKASA
jgi:hypothetical protein